jgi:hypothetical protein
MGGSPGTAVGTNRGPPPGPASGVRVDLLGTVYSAPGTGFRMRRAAEMRRTAIATLSVLLLAVAGCGGGKGAATYGPDNAPATATAAAPATPPAGAGGDCDKLQGLAAQVAQAIGGNAGTDSSKPEQLLQDLARTAPAEIRPDVQRIADAYTKIVAALGDVGSGSAAPSADAVARLQHVLTTIDQNKLSQANANITAWVQKHC